MVTSAGVDAAPVVGQGFSITPADLRYILDQIQIAEAHVANTTPATGPCGALLGTGAHQIPSPLLPFGLRTVDGSCNNLLDGQEKFGASDQAFPRLTTPVFNPAEEGTSYAQTSGNVTDSEPRTVSNLIVDQTSDNPAAVAAAGFPVRSQGNVGIEVCTSPGVPIDCVPEHQTLFIPNVTTDVGLSPPFNGLFTIFGQFFDHGLDKITNGGAGTVFVPLKADDPLVTLGPDGIAGNGDEVPEGLRFMTLTRGTIVTGPDGNRSAQNTDTPFVDQSQTYTSHSSHQVFLREYVASAGAPKSTGKFLSRPDGQGMATWSEIKDQASSLLGIALVDTDVNDIPLIAADPYGNFIPGPARGMPQMMMTTPGGKDGIVDDDPATGIDETADNNTPFLVEGNTAAPLSTATATRIGTAFLNDIAHSANPGTAASPKVADADGDVGFSLDQPAFGEYDDELLDAHFICGDGRCNENIALTAVHQMFHAEHDRLVDDIEATLSLPANQALSDAYHATSATTFDFGQRVFQAARFVTEMEYQHLVFEEFARKVQPAINPFEPFAMNQTDINPAITAEFAHAVYRFGHSMLTEEISRIEPDGTDNSIPLLTGFLNPPLYYAGSNGEMDSKEAATSIMMGMSDQVGNEIDEFVTNTLRNNLLGLPLDLPSINMTRARSEGIPSLNNLRKQIFASTNDGQLAPYENWIHFGQALKHPESLANFIAAYGTHPNIMGLDPDAGGPIVAGTLKARRMAAQQIVSGADLPGPDGILQDLAATTDLDEAADNIPAPADAGDFLFSEGATWANAGATSKTGLDDVDLWVGGLAEITNVFGGLLGSTFNYVFENQLTNLQNGDRFYYLARTPGMNLRSQLEGNSFSELVMRNTDAYALKADPFATADCKFHLANLTWPATSPGSFITGPGSVEDDPATECDENRLLLRQPTGRFEYRAINSVDPSGINGQGVYDGTANLDRIFGGNDNDTFWGREGNDIIDGRGGDDVVLGGDGNDIITDFAGFDVLKGGPGNDAIDGGVNDDILMGGDGADFTNGGANLNEAFLGNGNDFAIAGQGLDAVFGDAGDDWEEGGDMPDLLIGDSSTFFFDDHNVPGHDVTIGQGGDDDYDGEGGDDIFVAGQGIEKNAGSSGYDWLIGLGDTQPQFADLNMQILPEGQPLLEVRDRFNEVEALSGWNLDDQLFGDDAAPAGVGGGGFIGCDVLTQSALDRITGLDALVPPLNTPGATILANTTTRYCFVDPAENVWGDGNILLGGGGSDRIEGRGADDIIDGDKYLNVRLSVRTNVDDPATQIGSTDLLENKVIAGTGLGVNPATFGPGTANMTLQQAVFAGLVDPGNIAIVREILTPDASLVTGKIDTALFSAPLVDPVTGPNYTITTVGGVTTITDLSGVDGTDTLYNMERAGFCTTNDPNTGACTAFEYVALGGAAPAANLSATSLTFADRAVPVGASAAQTITVTNSGGGTLNITSTTITGANATSFARTTTCTTLAAGANCAINVTFDPTAAATLTATLAIVTNAGTANVSLTGTGITNTAATGAPAISDTTPTEGTAITATPGTVADVNGVPAVLSYQWLQSTTPAGAATTVIPLATSPTFTPTQLQSNRRLAVRVSFVDNAGTAENRTSAATIVVGDLFPGVGDDNSGINNLAGTAGQDVYHGGASADNLATGAEADLVSGDAGDDTISTAGGDDIITVAAGDGFDAVTGGAGSDAILAMADNINIGLRSISTIEDIDANGHSGIKIFGSALNDVLNFTNTTLTGILEINGGGGNDALTGSAGADTIVGQGGTDTINGGAGADIIEGGGNNDTLNGGAGNDTFRYLPVAGGFGTDTIANFDANPTGGQDLINLAGLGITAGNFAANVTIANAGGGVTQITVAGHGIIRLTGIAAAAVTVTDFVLA
jgi:Ca2+-binding RTX toxin-like protein